MRSSGSKEFFGLLVLSKYNANYKAKSAKSMCRRQNPTPKDDKGIISCTEIARALER